MGKTLAFDGKTPLKPGDVASPCGFMAKNFPLDDYKSLTSKNGDTFIVSTTGLIMNEEKEKFQVDTDTLQWVKVDDDRFINWMVVFVSPQEIIFHQQFL